MITKRDLRDRASAEARQEAKSIRARERTVEERAEYARLLEPPPVLASDGTRLDEPPPDRRRQTKAWGW